MFTDFRKSISEAIDAVKANSPDAEEIAIFGTEECINRIRDYIPSDVSAKILPAECFPETREELVYVIPIYGIKSLKFAFEGKPYDPKFEIMSPKYFGSWDVI